MVAEGQLWVRNLRHNFRSRPTMLLTSLRIAWSPNLILLGIKSFAEIRVYNEGEKKDSNRGIRGAGGHHQGLRPSMLILSGIAIEHCLFIRGGRALGSRQF